MISHAPSCCTCENDKCMNYERKVEQKSIPQWQPQERYKEEEWNWKPFLEEGPEKGGKKGQELVLAILQC